MAKRVFEIAKELGVASKAVVQKCRDEGIPESNIKNHMSTVSVGLEATIREWFGGEEAPSATSVETSKRIDLEKVRAKPRARKAAAKKATASESAETSTSTAVAEPPKRASRPSAASSQQPADDDSAKDTSAPSEQAEQAPEPEPQQPETETRTTPADEEPDQPAPAAGIEDASEQATAEPQSQSATEPKDADEGTGNGQSGAAEATKTPQAPAPKNVPTRPTVIKPAGPMIDQHEKTPVKLSGPKIVRVEAPEQVDTRPRGRGGPRGGGGGGGGGGFGGPAGPMPPGGDGGRRGGPSSRRRGRNEPQQGGSGMWREQDLIEREAKLQQAGGYLRKRRQDLARGAGAQNRQQSPAQQGGTVKISAPFTIKDLSAATGVKGAEIVKKLFMQGIMAQINSGIEVEKAQEIMMDFDIELEVTAAKSAEEAVAAQFEERTTVDERPRGPIVTILGHVDHGKTSLLDKIRDANVAAGEAGGITQATSAFRVPVHVGDDKEREEKQVVFIDTPGHEAFTSMRSRGANVTDIVVLVVAADDGVMPQTIESINHAKAAGVPIVVALNKIDRPQATDAKIQEILGQLAQHELNPVDWGGDVEVIRTSAISGQGIQELLETLDFQAQLLELKADFGGAARGTVIESQMEPGRGAVMNALLQEGSLKVGDFIVAGRAFGRVRDMTDDKGQRIREAHPPMPLQVTGIDELPDAGDKFFVASSLKDAQNAAEQRRGREREEQLAQPAMTLDRMFSQMAEAELKEILVVLKADVQGSVDVLKNEIEKVSGEEIKVRVIHAAVGGVTESDVLLAEASKAVIVGFNVIPSGKARKLADSKGVQIRTYDVIYHITEDMQKAAEGMLDPELRQEVLGHAEVRAVFKVSKVGTIAGCYVTDGVVQRDALIRVTRGDIVIENDRKLSQLKRFKDDAKEVRANMECGMKIDGYDDIKEGDILECYKQVEVKRTL
ncbi:MAG: translation initiation factor IF-2 [Phycisphaerales bacterium JB060]